jgi:hypothetical protein
MELGGHDTAMDAALDTLDTVLTDLINTVETGGLDQLSAAEKVAVWQRFEGLRNKLPVIDHSLIADAEASHLAEEYCSSTISQFLMRVLRLSHGEAASRVRAAAAVGPRSSVLGEKLEPQLPRLAAVQRDGAVSAEKVAIVERVMHKLSRPDLDAADVEQLTDHAPILNPADLRRFANAVINAADPDGPEPMDDQLQQDRRCVELTQRRDGMWHLKGRLTRPRAVRLWAARRAAVSSDRVGVRPR